MARKKRSGFDELVTDRAAFERGEARCPRCHRPVGPADQPTYVRTFGDAPAKLATMRCGRCNASLTLLFEDANSS
jgi:hypothetical protein